MNAVTPAELRDLASPEETAKRIARIEAAKEGAVRRNAALVAARGIYRTYSLVGDCEIKQALENIAANIKLPQDEWIKEAIAEICCDIEDLNAPVQPEISGIEPRGEFDAFTVGVRHRG